MKAFSIVVIVGLLFLTVGYNFKDYESVIDLGTIDTLENVEKRVLALRDGLESFDREIIGYTNDSMIDFINVEVDMVLGGTTDVVRNGVYYEGVGVNGL